MADRRENGQKSYLASALGHQACLKRYKVFYASTSRLLSQIKAALRLLFVGSSSIHFFLYFLNNTGTKNTESDPIAPNRIELQIEELAELAELIHVRAIHNGMNTTKLL